jgi:hypothetical protein
MKTILGTIAFLILSTLLAFICARKDPAPPPTQAALDSLVGAVFVGLSDGKSHDPGEEAVPKIIISIVREVRGDSVRVTNVVLLADSGESWISYNDWDSKRSYDPRHQLWKTYLGNPRNPNQ